MSTSSFRYGGGKFDIRSNFIRFCGWLQNKKVVFLDSDPEACAQVLASSEVKGTFIEFLLATPAWNPIYSIESVDGELWEQLAQDCRKVMGLLDWRVRLTPLVEHHGKLLQIEVREKTALNPSFVVSAETVSRFTARVMFELLFEIPLSQKDESLFYEASLEWRKEIGVKRQGNSEVKKAFWLRLTEVVAASKYAPELQTYSDDVGRWVSVFAQPFLISPQINVSDIMVAVFYFLRREPGLLEQVRSWADAKDSNRLNAVVMESIRLQHPFPILERELQKDMKIGEQHLTAGTQILLLFDRFKQDQKFDPDRWLKTSAENIYHNMPYGTGKRMCIGKPIATALLADLLGILLTQIPDAQVRPQQGHLYSGRNNDGARSSWRESLYQLKTFMKALWSSFKMGRRDPSHGGSCPFTGKQRKTAIQASDQSFGFQRKLSPHKVQQ
ncbi:MAG: cytochrome P450 [Bdellovibrionia bacterium]